MNKPYLSVTEAAQQKQVRRETIVNAIKTGRLKAQMIGSTYVIAQSDLTSYHPRPYQQRRTRPEPNP